MDRRVAPPITPEMRVGEFLGAYPELESVLIAQAPAFANLTNPVLRRTVAKVATLSQAARVGGVEVRALVRALRVAAGVDSEADAVAWDTTDRRHPAALVQRGPGRRDNRRRRHAGERRAPARRSAASRAGARPPRYRVRGCGLRPAPLVDAFRKQGYEVATFPIAGGRYRTAIARGTNVPS